mmetsp:Transcript_103720/g.178646  ORF Transcript_103720/g.178646 Transcript_103720/m.178646 type:complete len:309 (+) Transcript_103720:1069-1995(+)
MEPPVSVARRAAIQRPRPHPCWVPRVDFWAMVLKGRESASLMSDSGGKPTPLSVTSRSSGRSKSVRRSGTCGPCHCFCSFVMGARDTVIVMEVSSGLCTMALERTRSRICCKLRLSPRYLTALSAKRTSTRALRLSWILTDLTVAFTSSMMSKCSRCTSICLSCNWVYMIMLDTWLSPRLPITTMSSRFFLWDISGLSSSRSSALLMQQVNGVRNSWLMALRKNSCAPSFVMGCEWLGCGDDPPGYVSSGNSSVLSGASRTGWLSVVWNAPTRLWSVSIVWFCIVRCQLLNKTTKMMAKGWHRYRTLS